MAFFPANPPGMGVPDLERYLRTEFQSVARELELINARISVIEGYGGISGGGGAAGGDIGAGFTQIDQFSSEAVTVAVDVTQDVAGSFITINERGVWLLNVDVVFSHDASGAERQTALELYDGTAVLGSTVIGTGANAVISGGTISLLVDVTEDLTGAELTLRLGGGGTYTLVSYETLRLLASRVSA